MMNRYKSAWTIPFLLVVVLIAFLSLRQLSDPDIGSHLKAGKWIVNNRAIPGKDTFTYTVNSHDYIDMNWLFQVAVFFLFIVIGYKGLSILVMLAILGLLFLLLIRNQRKKVSLFIASFVFLLGFLVMETRITLRPEIFTFLFITAFLIILDDYYYHRGNRLFLLPVLMLAWCNMHGLFILGFGLIGAFLLSLVFRDKRIEKTFLLWGAATLLVCFINPYFAQGITFPLELLTRFDSSNVFHAHIKELKSFYDLDRFLLKDILFIIFLVLTFLFSILTWRKRAFHEFLLLIVFAYLALVSVRNIALFAVIGMPILCFSLSDFLPVIREKLTSSGLSRTIKLIRIVAIFLLIVIPLGLIMRLITGSYYAGNNEYSKTGIGIDSRQLPEKAAEFMIQNRLNGRIINGISLGGWLSWRLPQPVFIDGRLEVIKEDLYQELTESWKGGLSGLADKYQADLIVYNYVKYFPWTVQLAGMNNWRLIYIDGLSAILARSGYAGEIGRVNADSVCNACYIPAVSDETSVLDILKKQPLSSARNYFSGFWKKSSVQDDDLLNLGSFFLQMKNYPVVERFLLENLNRTNRRNRFIYYALADIYSAKGDVQKASVCYHQVLGFDPGNIAARKGLEMLDNRVQQVNSPATGQGQDAMNAFNEANGKYHQGDIQGAILLYDEAIRLSPGYSKAYNNRAIIKASVLKNYKDAIEDFSKAIEINPGYAEAYLGRGGAKIELNDADGACSDWQKAAQLGNKQAETLIQHFCPGRKQ